MHGRESGYAIRRELEFIGRWLVHMTDAGFAAAEKISNELWAFDLIDQQVDLLENRFQSHFQVFFNMLLRARGSVEVLSENKASIRRARRALEKVRSLRDQAALGFRAAQRRSAQPTLAEIDVWIENCPTRNSKVAWALLRNQCEMPRPSWKIFWERWTQIKRQKRGRPTKSP